MDENLITKKDLLELTGISYGALYRWKRMKLLPDDWFIHRSTFTGHETFFPRDKVLTRVREIQEFKETMSLEEIALHYTPSAPGALSLGTEDVGNLGVASVPVLNQYLAMAPTERFSYDDLLRLYIFSGLLGGGKLSRDEAFEAAGAAVDTEDVSEPVVYLLRKYGVSFCVIAGEMQKVLFDRSSALAETVVVGEQKAALGALLRQKGVTYESGRNQ